MNALLPPIKASFEHDGQPVAGGFVYFYEPGTTTPKTTWSDALGSVPNTNPVQLDSQGRATIFINGFYKVTVTSALGTALYTVDNVSASPYQTLAVSEWITSGVTPTYLSATSFSVPGDYTGPGTFEVGRRIRTVDAGGTDYGWVKTASFGAGVTTVTVILDAGSLDAGLASVDVGIASVTNRSLPTEPVVTKVDDYVLTAADVNKQFIFNKGTAVNFTLLAATAVPNGSLLRIKNIGAGVLTTTGTIDGVANPTLTQYGEMVIYSDGAVWSRSAPAYVSADGALRAASANPAANTVVVGNASGNIDYPAVKMTDGTNSIRIKIVDIGDWNMDATASVTVAHGLTLGNIRAISGVIRDDSAGTHYPITPQPSGGEAVYISTINATVVSLGRVAAGSFDTTSFDSTSFNRGWITITYVE